MIIKDLLKGLHVETNVDENLDIKGIAYDSRRVKDGDIFVCIKGCFFPFLSIFLVNLFEFLYRYAHFFGFFCKK